MEYVQIEMQNIKWSEEAADEGDWDSAPDKLDFRMGLEEDSLQSDALIDKAIADHLEGEYGFRPITWDLWKFCDQDMM